MCVKVGGWVWVGYTCLLVGPLKPGLEQPFFPGQLLIPLQDVLAPGYQLSTVPDQPRSQRSGAPKRVDGVAMWDDARRQDQGVEMGGGRGG